MLQAEAVNAIVVYAVNSLNDSKYILSIYIMISNNAYKMLRPRGYDCARAKCLLTMIPSIPSLLYFLAHVANPNAKSLQLQNPPVLTMLDTSSSRHCHDAAPAASPAVPSAAPPALSLPSFCFLSTEAAAFLHSRMFAFAVRC
jgi:hypothetical protein